MRLHSVVTILAAVFAAVIPSASFAAGNAPQPTICNRSCWGASASSTTYMSALNRAIIHHTASAGDFNTTSLNASKTNVKNIQNYHKNVNGWSDIGYHFLIDKLGNTFEGRVGSMSSLPRGAHDAVNTNSFGFSNMGYFHTPYNHQPPTVMRNACYAVIAWRMPGSWSPYGSGTYNGKTVGFVAGHRNATATACPGDIWYQYIGTNYSGGEARNSINSIIQGGGGSNPVTITVDNNNSGFSASSNWATSTSAADKHGADYRWRSTAAISDTASWTANLPASGSYDIRAWWPAGTNRAPNASYIMPDGASVAVNQQINGGSFRLLATKSLGSGNRTVQLSCWTTTGYVVVADAVRFYGPK